MRKMLCFFLMLIIVAALSAENEKKVYEKYNEALGFQYGEFSGSGISYYLMLGRLGFQVAGGILYFPYGSEVFFNGNLLDYTIGAEVQFEIYGKDFFNWLSSRVYAYTGICHHGYIPLFEHQVDPADPFSEFIYESGEFNQIVIVGAGIGIEIIFFKHLSIPIELGYGVYWDSALGSEINLLPSLLPQLGYRYRF